MMGREDFKASNLNPPENCGFSQVQFEFVGSGSLAADWHWISGVFSFPATLAA